MDRLEPPAALDIGRRQPVEQLGMRRRRAVEPEVAGRGHDPAAEMIVPEPIDHHPRGQRIGRVGDPVRERGSTRCLGRFGIENESGFQSCDTRGRNLLALLGGVAANEQIAFAGLAEGAGVDLQRLA